jgi:uroporphyrinogen-III synthase
MSLAGRRVLNTRPAHQATGLSAALAAAGAEVVELPLIAIARLPLAPEDERLLLDLDRYDGVFFVSANAARLGLDVVAGFWPQWPWRLPVYAVGASTAAVLADAGLDVVVPERADSEGLLALPALQAVAGRRFLLMRGEEGRELLPGTLRARGARVDTIPLYRRELPGAAPARAQALRARGQPDDVVLTSPDALRHWQAVAGAEATRPRWVVVSPRLREMAEAAGARVVEAAGADVDSLLAAVS